MLTTIQDRTCSKQTFLYSPFFDEAMGTLFSNMLKGDESLFTNPDALDFEFQPKLLKYRENQQFAIANCIKPLFAGRTGRNVVLVGQPGIGKTLAVKHILKELDEQTDEIVPVYLNCWQKNTTFKIVMGLCEALNYRLTHNKKTEELFEVVKRLINKQGAVIILDEIDKVDEQDVIYTLIEEIYKKTIILITNHKEWLTELDDRIQSRLAPEVIDFPPYTSKETEGILRQRLEYAFVSGCWDDEAFRKVADKTAAVQDIRTGLVLLREAGNAAEDKGSRKVMPEHVDTAMQKLNLVSVKSSDDLDNEEEKKILELAQSSQEMRIGDLFKKYTGAGGNPVYKTFQRRIKRLETKGFLVEKKVTGGADGTTSLISYRNMGKKLTEF